MIHNCAWVFVLQGKQHLDDTSGNCLNSPAEIVHAKYQVNNTHDKMFTYRLHSMLLPPDKPLWLSSIQIPQETSRSKFPPRVPGQVHALPSQGNQV